MTIAHAITLLTLALSASAPAQNRYPRPAQSVQLAASLASAQVDAPPPRLGVTTHFSQGWPISLIDRAKNIGVRAIRDSLHWRVIEKSPGTYDFSGKHALHITSACAAGMTVLLGIEPRNPLYDGNMTAHSPAARMAFANYVRAIADRYAGCVVAVEVGNEINGQRGMIGAAAVNRAASHTALLRDVYQRVKPAHPDLAILGGSTNVIGTGFLKTLFAAGALDYMDAVAVHPYRKDPEGVDWELERLNMAMTHAGSVKPIWVTEFSRDFAKPADAAPFFLKMVSLMHGAGVSNTYWYALIDQTWFPSMGLLTLPGESKPASQAFAYAAAQLIPRGQARRIDHGDPALFHFRYGATTHVVWGARRSITVDTNARFRNADGSISRPIAELSDNPIIIDGVADIQFAAPEILADSQYGFAKPPLSWFARSKTGALVALSPIDWKWTSYLGIRVIPQMIVNPAGIGPAGQYSAQVRYRSDQSVPAVASFCLTPLSKYGDGVTVALMHNEKQVWSGRVGVLTGKQVSQVPVMLQRGDTVDLVIAPNANAAGDRMAYRFRITRSAVDAPDC